jgi:fumarate reductase iron-sulfur subunit
MKITVYKYDPAVDAAPHYITGNVKYREKMTAMEALVDFHENIAAVNFDYSCATRLCGRCAMMLNGEPTLICVTPIRDKDYTFEPLKGFPVIRDLAVDKASFDNQLTRLYNRVRMEPFTETTIVPKNYNPDVRKPLHAMEYCCRCAVCNAGCPALTAYPDEFTGPAGMLAVAYRHLEPLDQGDRVMEAVNYGLYRCIMCGRCDELCPQQDIEHLSAWKILRTAAEKRGIKPSYAK